MAFTFGGDILNKFAFYPDKTSEIPKNQIPPYIHEKWITTSDKEKLQAFLFKQNDTVNCPLIIYFHGNAGNVYHRFVEGQRLYEMGKNVLLVSYRGYAKSTGKPTEKGVYIDGASAVAFAKDSLGYTEDNIVLFGRSLGTTVAVDVAQNKIFKDVILITPLTSGRDMANAMGMGSLQSAAGDSFNSITKIRNLKSPLLIIHGNSDEVVPYVMGKQLYDAYNGSKKLVTVAGGKHNNLEYTDSLKYWGAITNFLK